MEITGTQDKVRNRLWVDVLFILLTLILCTIATYPQLKSGDFPSHISWAAELAERHYSHRPNALYQQLVIVVKAFIPFNILNQLTGDAFENYQVWYYRLPGLLVTLGSYLATVLLLQHRFVKFLKAESKWRQVTSWIVALVCLFVNPILLFTLGKRLIIGYLPANVWHNPTYSLLRPFALWVYFFVVDHWKLKISGKQWLALGVMTGLSVFAKPNFVLSFLPALGLLLLLQTRSFRRLPWLLLSALVAPAALALLYQYVIMYTTIAENQIYLVPFKAALFSAGNASNMIIFYLLSLLFPLTVSYLSYKYLNDRFEFLLVWMNFGVALLTWLLFVELPHMSSLDLMWGPMLAVFLLFVYSIGWLLTNPSWIRQKSWQSFLTKITLGLHIISGIVYTLMTLINPGRVR